MDESEREKEKRDVSKISENKKKDRYSSFFRELRAIIQAHGYPVKGDRYKTSQHTTDPSQKKEGKVNLETSRDISNWIPSFQSYEDFKCKTLQSLDGFMIILSLDGVIIYVGGSITCLLGHLPDEIVGKKLLSLLPDHEKSEVYQKIALKLPSSSSVGKHTDFCCHIKRGNDKRGSNPTYEYVKLILTLKDISNEPLVLFSSFFPSPSFAESCGTYLPLEDRFYLVGSICILRTQILRDLFTVEKAGEDIQLINDSDEEHLSTECRSVQGQIRISRMESLCAEPAPPASDDQVDLITVKQYGLQESVHESGIESATCYDSSISSMESIPESSATSSLQSFEFEPDVEQVDDMDEVQQVDEVEKMGQIDEMEEVEQVDKEEEVERVEEVEEEDQLDQVEQEALSPFSVAGGISDELLEPLPSIALYINKRELGLMRKFREQLEEKTRMLQAEIRSLQDALEMMKEQLRRIEDSGFQIRGQFHQVPATEVGSQGSPDSEAFQDHDELTPGQINYFMSAEQSSLDEHQWDFHTEP
ncbi:circadian clock protein PASD1 isoform X3 [Prionailurus viverrinus]|uniref:circadian clock protein PASD1 isoform X3 n=1 Tax=Prionailurus viverrinus TaxID=61388 RepID=UPI001FF1FC9D|nr:circadian clock protein PASD1 isoform X3 [Prionailurus viverrinus]